MNIDGPNRKKNKRITWGSQANDRRTCVYVKTLEGLARCKHHGVNLIVARYMGVNALEVGGKVEEHIQCASRGPRNGAAPASVGTLTKSDSLEASDEYDT